MKQLIHWFTARSVVGSSTRLKPPVCFPELLLFGEQPVASFHPTGVIFFFFLEWTCVFEILGWNRLRLAFETERPSWIAKQQAGLGSRPNWLEQSGIFFFFLSLSNCCNKSQPWLLGSNSFSAPFRQPGSFHPIRFSPCLESTIQCFVILGVTACL